MNWKNFGPLNSNNAVDRLITTLVKSTSLSMARRIGFLKKNYKYLTLIAQINYSTVGK